MKRTGQWWVLAALLGTTWGASQALHWWQDRQWGQALKGQVGPGDIVLYTTSTCPYCAKARAWLDRQQVPWRECNIEQSSGCRLAFERQGAPGVPLVHAKGRWHLGFDPAWLSDVFRPAPAAPDLPGRGAAPALPPSSSR